MQILKPLAVLTVVAMVCPLPVLAETPASVRVQVKASQEARIASQMDGRVESLPFRLGDRFRKGDLLVGFGCRHQEATLAASQANQVRAARTLESREKLLAMQAVSDLDVELARAEKSSAEAEVERAAANVRDCRILAPFQGRVSRVLVNQWETVSRGTPLLEIVAGGPLEVEALVPSSWLVWLKKDQPFSLQVDELNTRVEARVTAIGARIDPVSQTVLVRGRILEQPAGLLPGMSGSALFAGAASD